MVEGDWLLRPPELLRDDGVHDMHLPACHIDAALVVKCLGVAEDHEASHWLGEILGRGILLRYLGNLLWLCFLAWGIVDVAFEDIALAELVMDRVAVILA